MLQVTYLPAEQRLLDVATACRESRFPGGFSMSREVNHICGTPACAVGNYAARKDLQTLFSIEKSNDAYVMRINGRPGGCWWRDKKFCTYFGISKPEALELFFSGGCGNATTTTQAAEYLEQFVARKVSARLMA